MRHSPDNASLTDTANKIMTGNSNGTVALYDVEKTGSKLERLKTHHQSGRGINVVSFGGPSGQGTLLASGCQDGDIKISVKPLRSRARRERPRLTIYPRRTFAIPPSSRYPARSTQSDRYALLPGQTAPPTLSTSSLLASRGISRDGISDSRNSRLSEY